MSLLITSVINAKIVGQTKPYFQIAKIFSSLQLLFSVIFPFSALGHRANKCDISEREQIWEPFFTLGSQI